jgi:hypothetical protein
MGWRRPVVAYRAHRFPGPVTGAAALGRSPLCGRRLRMPLCRSGRPGSWSHGRRWWRRPLAGARGSFRTCRWKTRRSPRWAMPATVRARLTSLRRRRNSRAADGWEHPPGNPLTSPTTPRTRMSGRRKGGDGVLACAQAGVRMDCHGERAGVRAADVESGYCSLLSLTPRPPAPAWPGRAVPSRPHVRASWAYSRRGPPQPPTASDRHRRTGTRHRIRPRSLPS